MLEIFSPVTEPGREMRRVQVRMSQSFLLPVCVVFDSVIARVLPQKVGSDSFCLFCDVPVCDVLGQARD